MSRRTRLAVAARSLAVAACIAPAALVVAAAAPAAQAAARCSPPKYPGLGYFTSAISVSGVSCTTGRKLAVAY
ncbi:MAG: hypothetical protein ACR2KV_08510 [Solirubrobacteraceae bacterium]